MTASSVDINLNIHGAIIHYGCIFLCLHRGLWCATPPKCIVQRMVSSSMHLAGFWVELYMQDSQWKYLGRTTHWKMKKIHKSALWAGSGFQWQGTYLQCFNWSFGSEQGQGIFRSHLRIWHICKAVTMILESFHLSSMVFFVAGFWCQAFKLCGLLNKAKWVWLGHGRWFYRLNVVDIISEPWVVYSGDNPNIYGRTEINAAH